MFLVITYYTVNTWQYTYNIIMAENLFNPYGYDCVINLVDKM